MSNFEDMNAFEAAIFMYSRQNKFNGKRKHNLTYITNLFKHHITSSHSFEYVGAGTDINRANPFQGGEPIPANEIVAINGGQVPFTSTDQKGNFRIGQGLEINQTTSTISGRDFNRAIQANLTPLILALGG